MGTLSDWFAIKNAKEETDKLEDFATPSMSPIVPGSGIITTTSGSTVSVSGHGIYGSTLIGGSSHSSAYYDMMAANARIEERNVAMTKLADKLGFKSAEDVEALIKELGL